MDELADTYRPILERSLARATPPTQALLRPSLEQVLNGIEAICPAVLQMTPAGLQTAYGPEQRYAELKLLVLAATPDRHFIFGKPKWEWPKLNSGDAGGSRRHTPATIWAAIVASIQQANPEAVFNGFTARTTLDARASIRAEAIRCRRKGYVPLLVIMCAAADGKAAGMVDIVPLPPSIDAQLGDAA